MKIKSILYVGLAIMLLSCNSSKKSDRTLRRVETVQPIECQQYIEKCYPALISEDHHMNLGTKVAGEILQVLVREGKQVKEGELLVKLDSKDYQLGLDAARVQYNQLSQEVERMRTLLQKKSISQNDFDKASAGLEALAIQVEGNQRKVDYTLLYAPISGMVSKVNYSKGEMVDAGTPIVELITEQRKISVEVPASIYFSRDEIQSSRLLVNGHELPLCIVSFVARADRNQLYELTLSAKDNTLLERISTAGQNAQVVFRMKNHSTGVDVPYNAIFMDSEKECVWVLKADSTLEKREVTALDKIHDGMRTVTSGLEKSETIIRAGASSLQHKEKVKVLERKSETNIGGLL
ncbi:MAG: efflux RND transporter periplasmic adaptor subunit [Alistipes sp.]|nr:efflux RND transporter periplasmic adaptor subunit [Candidatus Alistipes equi]